MSEFNQKEYHAVVLGALLHDIGKVVQRASENPTLKKHTEWGYEWLLRNGFDETTALSSLAHHYHKDYTFKSNITLIWYQADNLSSGERKDIEDEEFEEAEWHKEVLLASPFSRIRNPVDLKSLERLTYLPLIKNLTLETVIVDETQSPAGKDEYKKLLNDFEDDLKIGKEQVYQINFLLMLYEKYFSNVPSITSVFYHKTTREEIKSKHPDISLYDHSKLTAAIAACMYHYYRETYPDKWKREVLKDEILCVPEDIKPYLLIGGDISGIQKFIYTITSKGALKSLKGRSFFLELLTEHVISKLIKSLGLTRCNIIFAGGGHFYILSHNTPSSIKVITSVRESINNYLLEEFQGALQIHIVYIPFHPRRFNREASLLWESLSEKLEEKKKRKWINKLDEVLKVKMPYIDEDEEKSCLTRSCEICFREDLSLQRLPVEDEDIRVCEPCLNQYKLGSRLVQISKRDYPVIYRFKSQPGDEYIKIEDRYYVVSQSWSESLHNLAETVYRVNDFTAKHYTHPDSVYLFLGIYQHDKMTELSDVSGEFGISRIGVLRMDVDNLGKIFSEAVAEEDRTFSRMASISRKLNEFFKYYLNSIVEGRSINNPVDVANRKVSEEGRKLSIVYSGGDDLFIIGHWLDIVETAFDINRYFRNFTGNPYLTISGGIAINHEKYPVYQYAREAEVAEKIAKNYRTNANDRTKDSITLFKERVFKWDEVTTLIDRVKMFVDFLKKQQGHLEVDENRLPKTFFYRLLGLARKFKDDGVLILPKAAYLISKVQLKENDSQNELKIKEVIMTSNPFEWKITETATLWVLMMMRKGGSENE